MLPAFFISVIEIGIRNLRLLVAISLNENIRGRRREIYSQTSRSRIEILVFPSLHFRSADI